MARPVFIHPIPRAGDPREPARAKTLAPIDGFQSELDGLHAQRAQRLDIVEKTIGPTSQRYLRAREQYEDARDSVENARILVKNRELMRHPINPFVYAAFALVFLAFEAPINKFVFDVAFGSIALYSWSGAITLGLILLIIAHFDGVALRQVWSESRKRPYIGKALQFVVFTAFLLVAITCLAVARYRYSLAGTGQSLGSLVDDFSQIKSTTDLLDLVKTAFSETTVQVLAIANAGGILAAIVVAMISHDPDANYDAAARRLKHVERPLRALERRYGRALARVNRRFAPRIKRLNEHIAAAKQRPVAVDPDDD